MPTRIRASPNYDAHLTTPVPKALQVAVAKAASTHLMSGNSYVRAALLAKLRADGFAVDERKGLVVATAR
jgi:hypothetical protein